MEKEQKSGFPRISAMHVIIALVVIVLAVIFIAKFGYNIDLISPSSGEMSIAKQRLVTPVTTLVQKQVVRPTLSIRPALSIRPEPIPTCATPTTMCGDTCVDVKTDSANCGYCGRVCSVAYADAKNVAEYGCAAGQCTIQSCQPGYGDCSDKGPLNVNGGACETNLKDGTSWIYNQYDTNVFQQRSVNTKPYLENPRNCGSCGNACTGGSSYFGICDNGACRQVCWGPWLNCNSNMNDGCEQVFEDNNCGACGAKCAANSLCKNGCCVLKTDQNQVVADSLGVKCSGNMWQRMG